MKKTLLAGMLAVITAVPALSQNPEEMAITQAINTFAKAADNSDANAIAEMLDDNFRIVMNQLFGSKEVSIMPKTVYVEKIRTKEFGGEPRKVTIENVMINGNTASARITYAGAKMTFVSLTSLIKNADGQWKLVSEMPVVK